MNVTAAKVVSGWKTDDNGSITKAKTRLGARGFGQRFAVGYFETFSATPAMKSQKLVMPLQYRKYSMTAAQYHFDVTESLLQAEMGTNVYAKLPDGCGPLTGNIARLG